MLKYLNQVGKIRKAKASSTQVYVRMVQHNALMGFVADVVTSTLSDFYLITSMRLLLVLINYWREIMFINK
jgi:hypothetical protein